MKKKLNLLLAVLVVLIFVAGCSMSGQSEESSNEEDQYEKSGGITFPLKTLKKIRKAKAADTYENDDSMSAANTIAFNEEQEHNFYDDANDWMKFTAVSGTEYTIESWVYNSADTVLYLYNSSSAQLAYNDDKGDGTYGSQITWTATYSGTVYIKSSSYNGRTGSNRTYVISVLAGDSSSGGDSYEEDDSSSQANTITVDAGAQSHNFYDDANDWLKFSGVSGKTYEIESWVGGDADTVLYLYNSSLSQLASNDDKGDGTYGSKITYSCTSSGTYYIKVNSYSNRTGDNREYTISVTQSNGGGSMDLPLAEKKWTVMVYLDGDNNLSSYANGDIDEMKEVGSTDDFNIVVLWDNSSSIHGYYYIEENNALLLEDLGEVNMGDDQTAIDFVDYTVDNFPAEKYFFIYWNHGGAVDRSFQGPSRGVCWDDTNGGDHLTETEQENIVQYMSNKIGDKIDIVGYDACLMACAEIGYLNSFYADYLVASEETEPGYGWDYVFLDAIKSNPNISASALSNAVLNSYMNFYSSYRDVTFSVADLAYADDLVNALDDFCKAAIQYEGSSELRNLTSGVGDFSGYTKDLYGYLNKVYNSSSITATVKNHAQTVMNIITNNYIISEDHGSNWNNLAYGVSITMKSDTTTYSRLDICIDSDWDEFLSHCGF
ncbi:MAG: clostripain-related cysteine peptidase [Spirochaetes bacterium]|nr:clostripain-related cysteine peptidase [Spirochaetota bacterium]